MTENEAKKYFLSVEDSFKASNRTKSRNDAYRMALSWFEEIQQYREIERRLQNIYGECDGLLETVVQHLENHENIKLPDNIIKARLLTDEDVDKWEGYRAIGTVEELKSLKENGAFSGIELAQIASMQMKLKEYQSIGTIDEFKALKEKNTPYKPKEYEDRYYACKCDNILLPKWEKYPTKMMPKSEGLPHCMACGQKLDWK